MNFLAKLLQGISLAPTIINGVEGLLGAKTGTDKKNAALNFVQSAISVTDARRQQADCRSGKIF